MGDMPECRVKDPSLAPEGLRKIEWVRAHMPLLFILERRFCKERPFAGLRVALSIHLEAKTARLALLLSAGGAEVYATGSNPLSTQDDVAAALASLGVRVYAVYGADPAEYRAHLMAALECRPHLVIDDGGDFVDILLDERPDLASKLIGGCEETTTGVRRLRARDREGSLRFPMICVNDAKMKYLLDNRYGTGQSVWDGIMRTTNLVVAGKIAVVAGYGWCGKGVARRAVGFGARVIVCEVDPIKAVEAVMDGFDVMPMEEAAALGDFFVTVTGCRDVITPRHVGAMKEGAILCNAGHFDVEVAAAAMRREALSVHEARRNIEVFAFDGGRKGVRTVCLLAGGRLVNLAAGDGHPAEIMDISFALQALSAEHLIKNARNFGPGVHEVPEDIDVLVARMKLETMGKRIDTLSGEQEAYLRSSGG